MWVSIALIAGAIGSVQIALALQGWWLRSTSPWVRKSSVVLMLACLLVSMALLALCLL